MDWDFGPKNDEPADFVSVPAGTYLCRIAEVRVGETRQGDERWGLKLVVAEGEFVGRHAAWDGLVYSKRGQVRARLVLEAFGIPTAGKVQIETDDLMGLEAFVEVRPVEYRDPRSQRVVRRNEVPFEGYSAVPPGREAPAGTPRAGGLGAPAIEGPPDDDPMAGIPF